MRAKKLQTEESSQETKPKPSLFKRVCLRDRDYTTEEWKKIAHWFKQTVAVVIGIIWGLLPLLGFPAFIMFVHTRVHSVSHFIISIPIHILAFLSYQHSAPSFSLNFG